MRVEKMIMIAVYHDCAHLFYVIKIQLFI